MVKIYYIQNGDVLIGFDINRKRLFEETGAKHSDMPKPVDWKRKGYGWESGEWIIKTKVLFMSTDKDKFPPGF